LKDRIEAVRLNFQRIDQCWKSILHFLSKRDVALIICAQSSKAGRARLPTLRQAQRTRKRVCQSRRPENFWLPLLRKFAAQVSSIRFGRFSLTKSSAISNCRADENLFAADFRNNPHQTSRSNQRANLIARAFDVTNFRQLMSNRLDLFNPFHSSRNGVRHEHFAGVTSRCQSDQRLPNKILSFQHGDLTV